MKERISIIIPIYNAEKYLEKCLESIRRQTYQPEEVWLIDDGSTDTSGFICQEYINKYSFFHYYKQKNKGSSVARNRGIEFSKGDWICFIDADDYIKEDMLERLVIQIKDNIDVICCGCMAVVGEDIYPNPFFKENRIFEENKRELFLQLLGNNYNATAKYLYTAVGVPWGKLYRKSFLQEWKILFNPELKRMQDNVFNLDVFWYARQIKYIDYLGYYYIVEHVEKYAEVYDEKAVEYLSKVIVIQMKKMELIGLLKDEEILRFLIQEAVALFILAVQKSYYMCPCINYWEKCKRAKELLHSKPYSELFMNVKDMRNVKILKAIVSMDLLCLLFIGKRIWKWRKKVRYSINKK